MRKITAYLMAPCRGRDGDNVLPEVKWANVQKAIEIGSALRNAFPCLDLFVPHEHEVVIDQLWRDGLSSDKIIDATSKIAQSKEISFCFDGDGASEGMAREIDTVTEIGKPVVYFAQLDDETMEKIAIELHKIGKE